MFKLTTTISEKYAFLSPFERGILDQQYLHILDIVIDLCQHCAQFDYAPTYFSIIFSEIHFFIFKNIIFGLNVVQNDICGGKITVQIGWDANSFGYFPFHKKTTIGTSYESFPLLFDR